MNLRNYLVKVVAEFFYAYLLLGRYEDARGLLLGDPAVLELVQGAVHGLLGLEGELVVGLVGVGIHLVEDHQHGLSGGTNVPEGLLHHLHLLFELRVGDVHHMHQDIGLPDLVKGALESLHQLGGQLADEAHGVAEQEGNVLNDHFPHGGVQRGEEFVLRKHVRFGQ